MRKFSWMAAVGMTALGIVTAAAAGQYGGSGQSCGILTPAYEELAGEQRILPDARTPLAGGPGMLDGGGQGSAVMESPLVIKVVDLVNQERTKAGLLPLEKAEDVIQAADVRARELTSSFSHTRPDGSAYRTVLEQNGVSFRISGENVAFGYSSPEAVMSAWMNSEGHRENILNDRYTTIGVGHYTKNGQEYWAQLFTTAP